MAATKSKGTAALLFLIDYRNTLENMPQAYANALIKNVKAILGTQRTRVAVLSSDALFSSLISDFKGLDALIQAELRVMKGNPVTVVQITAKDETDLYRFCREEKPLIIALDDKPQIAHGKIAMAAEKLGLSFSDLDLIAKENLFVTGATLAQARAILSSRILFFQGVENTSVKSLVAQTKRAIQAAVQV